MSTLAFLVIAAMIATYILRDGYDLGVGAINLFIARSADERAENMATIGPFWNGNEVWLIATGGTLFALFPQAYASAFSGFYLPFMVVLWLLMFRGIAIELRNHFQSELWQNFFDVCFTFSSALLILLFGVAIGNVLRGVPMDARHYFTGTFAFLLNPYALAVGLLALLALAQHGAAFLVLRVDGPQAGRAMRLVAAAWPVLVALYVAVTAWTFAIHSPLPNFTAAPVLFVFPLASFAGLVAVRFMLGSKHRRAAFNLSSVFVGGMMGSAAATLYPYLLSGYPSPTAGLTIFADVPTWIELTVTCSIAIAGLAAVTVYQWLVGRHVGREAVK